MSSLSGLKKEDIKSIEINPIPNDINDDTFKVVLTITKNDNNTIRYISRDTELDFFIKANSLLYNLEYRNIQDIMNKPAMKNDIYNLFTYLWNKNKIPKLGNYFEKKTIANTNGTQKIIKGSNRNKMKQVKQEHQQKILDFILDKNNFT